MQASNTLSEAPARAVAPSLEQYNYWRLLSDLNLGFSMIGVYGGDLANADKPECRAAFDFAARYAGYHASPSVSLGAWVALREGGLRLSWKIAEFEIAPVSFAADADGAHIVIEGDTDVTLHMIEVARGNGSQ